MTTLLEEKKQREGLKCVKCAREHQATGKRLPHGWKRWREELYCGDCWGSLFVLRAISVPIAEPLDTDWKGLRTALRLMWRQTTQASNWIITELWARDVRRRPGDEKMPAMPATYLYPEIRVRFPDLPPPTVASLEQAVTRKYLRGGVDMRVQPAHLSLPCTIPGAQPELVDRRGERAAGSHRTHWRQ